MTGAYLEGKKGGGATEDQVGAVIGEAEGRSNRVLADIDMGGSVVGRGLDGEML